MTVSAITTYQDYLARTLLVACDMSYDETYPPASGQPARTLAPYLDSPGIDGSWGTMPQNFIPDSNPVGPLSSWTYINRYADANSGFAVDVFEQVVNGKASFIFSFQGTRGINWQDWLGNLGYGTDKWFSSYLDTNTAQGAFFNFLETQVKGLLEAGTIGSINFTGQSLGGALAEYAAYDFVKALPSELQATAEQNMNLVTFNGLGSIDGLKANETDFNENLLSGVNTQYYVVANDFVSRLGGGHLNEAGNEWLLNAYNVTVSGTPVPLATWTAHRIENGFYTWFNYLDLASGNQTNAGFNTATSFSNTPLPIDDTPLIAHALSVSGADDDTLSPWASLIRLTAALALGAAIDPLQISQIVVELAPILCARIIAEGWISSTTIQTLAGVLCTALCTPQSMLFLTGLGLTAITTANALKIAQSLGFSRDVPEALILSPTSAVDADTTAMFFAMKALSPLTTPLQISSILAAYGGDGVYTFINSLFSTLPGLQGNSNLNTEGLSGFAAELEALTNSYSGSLSISALAGLSVTQLADRASTDLAVREALRQQTPYAVTFPGQTFAADVAATWNVSQYRLDRAKYAVSTWTTSSPAVFDNISFTDHAANNNTATYSGKLGAISAAVTVIFGKDGGDTIIGDSNTDRLYGGYGSDEVWAGSGSDLLVSGGGGNFLFEGAGTDTFVVVSGDTITVPEGASGIGQILIQVEEAGEWIEVPLTGGFYNSSLGGWVDESGTVLYKFDTNGNLHVSSVNPPANDADPFSITIRGLGLAPVTFQNGVGTDENPYSWLGMRFAETPAANPLSNQPYSYLSSEIPLADAADPVVFDLSGTGTFETIAESAGVHFDFSSSGFAESTAWVGPQTGILVVCPDGVSDISSGKQLFSNLQDLAAYDTNGDNVLDANDTIWSSLKIWFDGNINAVADGGELVSLSDLGIVAINLNASTVESTDSNGVTLVQTTTFVRSDGTTGLVGSLSLPTNPISTIPDSTITVPPALTALPALAGSGDVYSLQQAMAQNSTLASMVGALSVSDDFSNLKTKFEAVLVEWVGASNIAVDSRGPNVNAQHLAVLEDFSGQKYSGQVFNVPDSSYPNYMSGPLLEDDYNRFVASYFWRFLAQAQFREAWQTLNVTTDSNGNLTADAGGIETAFSIAETLPGGDPLETLAMFAWTISASGLFSADATAPYYREIGTDSPLATADCNVATGPLIFEVGLNLARGNDWHKFTIERDLAGNLTVVDSWGVLESTGNIVVWGTQTLLKLSNASDSALDNVAIVMGDGEVLAGKDLINSLTLLTNTDASTSGSANLVFNSGDGANVVNQYKAEGSAQNSLTFGAGINLADLAFEQVNSDLVIHIVGSSDSLTVQGYFSATQDEFSFISFADGTLLSGDSLPVSRILGFGETQVSEDFSDSNAQLDFTIESYTVPSYAFNPTIVFQKDLLGHVWFTENYQIWGSTPSSYTLFSGTGIEDSGINELSITMPDGSVLTGQALFNLFSNATTDATAVTSENLKFNLGDGENIVNQWKTAGSAQNSVTFGAGISADDLTFTQVNNDLVIAVGTSSDRTTIQGYFAATQNQFSSFGFADGASMSLTSNVVTRELGFAEGAVTEDMSQSDNVSDFVIEMGSNPYYAWNNSTIFQKDLLGHVWFTEDYLIFGSGYVQSYGLFTGSNSSDDTIRSLMVTMPDGSVLTGQALFSQFINATTDATASISEQLAFNRGDGTNIVNQNKAAGSAQNTLTFGEGVIASDLGFTRVNNDLVIAINNSTDQVTVQGYFSGQQDQFSAINFADGSSLDPAAIAPVRLIGLNETPVTLDYSQPEQPTNFAIEQNNLPFSWYYQIVNTVQLRRDLLGNLEIVEVEKNPWDETDVAFFNATNLSDAALAEITFTMADGTVLAGETLNASLTHVLTNASSTGAETLEFSRGDGANVVNQYKAAGSAQNSLNFGSGISASDLTFTRVSNDLLISLNNGIDSITVQGYFASQQNEFNALTFTDGTSAKLTFGPAEGSISLEPTSAQLVDGGAGNSTLTMTDGVVLARSGNSNMTLQGASDVLLFDAGDGVDLVQNRSQNLTISLGGGLSWNDLSLEQDGNDLVLDIGSTGRIDLQNYFQNPGVNIQLQMFEDSDSSGVHADLANLSSIVTAFEAAGPQTAPWSIDNALTNLALTAETNQAYGGDVAAYYALNGTLGGLSSTIAQAVLKDAGFGSSQALTDPTQWQNGKYQMLAA